MLIELSHVEPTPNPNAFKFHTGESLLPAGLSLSFANPAEAERLQIARKLFEQGDVEAVLIADDFVSVSGTRTADWKTIREIVEQELTTYDVAQTTTIAEQVKADAAEAKKNRPTDELTQKIEEIIDMYVRPALAGDGGGVELVSVEAPIVKIRYQGACGSCPTSTAATLGAIENLIREKVDPELTLEPA